MSKVKTCPICGEPTYLVYGKHPRKDGLCSKHSQMLFNEEIEQCPECNAWNKKGERCACQDKRMAWLFQPTKKIKEVKTKDKEQQSEEQISTENIIIDKGIRCITCGFETDGKLFCKKCYGRYCEKEILIKIKNCREVVPLDDFYEGYYECDDGHVVKSMAERDIDDYLFAHNIKHGYEVPIKINDEKGKSVLLHPDFCIFDQNSNPQYYIEYWGYDDSNRDYTKTKKYKIPLYEKAGITLINVNAKFDLRNLKMNLKHKLNNFKKNQINFLNE